MPNAGRYKAGWEQGCSCPWTAMFPPGCVPIIDSKSIGALGEAIAIAVSPQAADQIVSALNFSDAVRSASEQT